MLDTLTARFIEEKTEIDRYGEKVTGTECKKKQKTDHPVQPTSCTDWLRRTARDYHPVNVHERSGAEVK